MLIRMLVIFFCTLIFSDIQATGEMYKWVDENGVVRFSDTPTMSEENNFDVETIQTVKNEQTPPSVIDSDNTDAESGESNDKVSEEHLINGNLSASGYAIKEGSRMEFNSATATWDKDGSNIHIMVYPFKFTAKEKKDILSGKGRKIINAQELKKRPYSDEEFYFWIGIEFDGSPVTSISQLKSYWFSFQYFDDKGTSTGTGEWVKEYSEFKEFKAAITDQGGQISFDFYSKAGAPFDWEIDISVDTTVHEVY